MKKVLFIVAAAALFFSCEKEIEPVNPAASGKGFTFTAGIENLATKADINSSNELVWASGDKIGVYVNDESWGEKNQPFTLEGDGGTTTGKFKWDYEEGNFTNENASFAFFPWQGSTTDDNNVSGENMYFKLRETYEPYTSGQMLTPLVANVTRSGDDYAPIEFKHAGAAVKLVINNLPAGAKSAGLLGAEGSSLWGTYSIPASVGETPASMTLVASEDKGDGVWLHFDAPAETMSEPFTFLFPVPEVAASKLTFKIYDKYDVLVWSRSTTLSEGLGRADVLNLPALDITPYKKLNTVSTFGVRGVINGVTNWDSTVCEMVTDGSSSVAKGLTLSNGDEIKVTDGSTWSSGDNWAITADGTYDVIYNHEKNTLKVVTTGECPYPGLPHLELERQWGWYSGDALWTDNVTGISITHPDNYGMSRGLAMDDENIYLPKSSAYANAGSISIFNPATQAGLPKSNISGGSIFTTSFARVIKNTDSSVNGGKDVLLVCNLTATNSDEDQLRVWAYADGVNSAPTQIAGFCYDPVNNTNDWRRYGDRFFVTGTYQEGKLYFPSFNPNKIVVLSIANGARTAVTQIAAGESNSPTGIKDLTVYPGDNKLFLTNESIANLVTPTGGTTSQGWDEYTLSTSSDNGKGTWGYNFFEFNGKNYIAYARTTNNVKAWIEVIEDTGDLAASLESQSGLLRAPLHSATDLEAEHATGGVGDCCVRVIDGVPYIAALTRDGGLAVYKMVIKQ